MVEIQIQQEKAKAAKSSGQKQPQSAKANPKSDQTDTMGESTANDLLNQLI
jgi:hypothetical protein